MQKSASRSDWTLAFAVIAGLTAWRLAMLAFDGTDLFMDEAQYWFWGQNPDFGYFSKPPMIAWVSRAVTDVAGSDAIFWVRAPGAVLHAITAILTGLAAARLFGTRVGLWAAILYVTTPFATLGSWLYSTDTILLPFFAAALLAYVRLTEQPSARWALALGAFAGLGILSKYAMLYLPLMAGLAALLVPRARIAWRDAVLALAAATAVASPNLAWNIANGGSTVKHVALDNARLGHSEPDLARGLEFLASQFGVFGPILFALLFVALWRVLRRRAGPEISWLLLLSLPVIALMTLQAVRALAYANWAVTAYVAGTVLAAALLVPALPRLRWTSLALHLALALGFPLLYVFPHAVTLPDGRLLAARYLGQSALSREIAETARAANLGRIVAEDRAVLADLHYTLRGDGFTIRAVPPRGAARTYYEQAFPLDPGTADSVLFVHERRRLACAAGAPETLREITPRTGTYRGRAFRLARIAASCLQPRRSS